MHDLWRSASHSCSSCVFCCHLLEAVSVEIWPHNNSWSSSWTSSRSVVFLPSLKITLYPSYLKIHLISHSVFIISYCSLLICVKDMCCVCIVVYKPTLHLIFKLFSVNARDLCFISRWTAQIFALQISVYDYDNMLKSYNNIYQFAISSSCFCIAGSECTTAF